MSFLEASQNTKSKSFVLGIIPSRKITSMWGVCERLSAAVSEFVALCLQTQMTLASDPKQICTYI